MNAVFEIVSIPRMSMICVKKGNEKSVLSLQRIEEFMGKRSDYE